MNEFVLGILNFVVIVAFVTAVLDMAMNGARDAEWAPWGFGLTLVCLVIGAFL